MKSQYLGNLTANTKTMVFEKIQANNGYCISLSTTAATGTINISVYESNGGDARNNGLTPLTSDAQYWVQVASSGTASATEAYALNRENFRGKFVYMDIGITAGSLDDVIVHFNQD